MTNHRGAHSPCSSMNSVRIVQTTSTSSTCVVAPGMGPVVPGIVPGIPGIPPIIPGGMELGTLGIIPGIPGVIGGWLDPP